MTRPRDGHDRAPDAGGHDDPVDALRAAFAGLAVPAPTPADDRADATDTDALTRASVDWMRAAQAALPVPAAPAPPAARPRLRLVPWRRQLAAAAVLLAVGLLMQLTHDERGPVPGRGDDVVDSGTATPDAPTTPPVIPGFRAAGAPDAGLLASSTEHLEVSSGPVRLVLVPFASATSDDASPPLR